jgi:drug/metabolite transporter (DMT)-like permease
MPSSSEASRMAANMMEAPKKTTIVQSTVFRSTGSARYPGGADGPLVSARVNHAAPQATHALGDRPVLAGVLGALVIAFSAILVKLAEVTPSTSAFFRCAYAVPVLALLAWLERRRYGPRPWRARLMTMGAGVLFAGDLVAWHYSIQAVGAGLATVLGNIQLVLVALLAWVLLRERPTNRTLVAIPVVFLGVVLISGVIGSGAYGDDPLLGVIYGVTTAICYAGVLLMLRHANADLRRPAGPLFEMTLVSAVCCGLAGVAIGDIDWVPRPEAQAWLALLALSSQVLGWLLISVSLPRLPAVLTSILLVLQPVCTVFLGAVLLSEAPSAVQLSGVAVVLGGVAFATLQPTSRKRPVSTS